MGLALRDPGGMALFWLLMAAPIIVLKSVTALRTKLALYALRKCARPFYNLKVESTSTTFNTRYFYSSDPIQVPCVNIFSRYNLFPTELYQRPYNTVRSLVIPRTFLVIQSRWCGLNNSAHSLGGNTPCSASTRSCNMAARHDTVRWSKLNFR